MARLQFAVIAALLLAACARGEPGGQPGAPGEGGLRSGPKIIAIGLDEDVKNIWDAITSGGGSGSRELSHLVNQFLAAIGSDGTPHPRLLAELPSQERGTWRVFPDGKMETTYKLRTGVVWHDGTPFTAEDVLFSWEVNRDPEVPNANQEAVKLIERMQAADSSTVVVTWSTLYPYADRLEHRELFPVAKHLLERSYQESKESFLFQPYFSAEFVGLGPYRLQRWESGSHLELAAFDKYFFGRPKIDTIRVQFIPDRNTMLANLNARAIQAMLTLGNPPDFDSMMLLKRSWEADRYGTVVSEPISYRFLEPQKLHNPYPADLVDPRVRQGLMYSLDRSSLAQVLLGELGVVADAWVHPSFRHYPVVQDAITRYPYDPRRATAQLEEVGWRRGSDGVLEKGGQRFTLLIRDRDGETVPLILADQLKAIGVSGSYELRTQAQLRDRQDRATFTGIEVTNNPMSLASATRKTASYNIPTADNRWTGSNRGGYSHPQWDELDRRGLAALTDVERVEVEREALRLYTVELPLLPLLFSPDLIPVGGGLTGIVASTGTAHRGFIMHTWNVHEWDLK